VARLIHLFATTTPEQVLKLGKLATMVDLEPEVDALRKSATASTI
jgi:hypothetical protein